MNYREAQKLSDFPQAFCHLDTWMLVNEATGKPIEGHTTKSRAQLARDTCNEHERRHNRPQVYVIVELTPL